MGVVGELGGFWGLVWEALVVVYQYGVGVGVCILVYHIGVGVFGGFWGNLFRPRVYINVHPRRLNPAADPVIILYKHNHNPSARGRGNKGKYEGV